MKLFKVQFEVELMVLAESEEMAEEAVVTKDFDWTDEIPSGAAFAREVTDVKDVLEPDSLPWFTGDEDYGNLTCAQFLAKKQG